MCYLINFNNFVSYRDTWKFYSDAISVFTRRGMAYQGLVSLYSSADVKKGPLRVGLPLISYQFQTHLQPNANRTKKNYKCEFFSNLHLPFSLPLDSFTLNRHFFFIFFLFYSWSSFRCHSINRDLIIPEGNFFYRFPPIFFPAFSLSAK